MTGGGFGAAVDNAPLHALADADERQRRLRLQRAPSAFPTSTLRRQQLLGRRAVRARRRRPARSPASPRPPARPRRRCRWTAPATGGPADVLRGHAVHRRDGADADDRHRHAAGHDHDDHRADRRARPTRSRCTAANPSGYGRGLGRVERGHADRRRRAGGADRRRRPQADSTSALVELDGARRRRRQRDHRLHGDAVRRRDGADAGRRSAPRRPRARVTGLTNGTALHVHGHGDQRRRDRPGVGAPRPRSRRARRSSSSATPAIVDARRHRARSCSA